MKEFRLIATLGEKEIRNLQKFSLKNVSILEIRLDQISKKFISKGLIAKLETIKKDLLFTYRLPEDSSLSEHTRLEPEEILELIGRFNSKKNFLDIDLKFRPCIFDSFTGLKYRKIYSYHNFSGILSDKQMQAKILSASDKSGIFKFAVMPRNMDEVVSFLEGFKKLSSKFEMIGILMGELGRFTRIYGDLFGSRYSYCSIEEPKAPGQMHVDLVTRIRHLSSL